jgi:flavin reductase (DIM6/NTAB) family NADH-FMN oxidoreductase RutF
LASPSVDEYRAAMRRHPAGVVVITLKSAAGPVGFTATSFASLSVAPPLVSFNISQTSSSIGALRCAKSIVVHILGEHQRALAQRFSRSAERRFADGTLWTNLDSGEPLLHGTPTVLRALLRQMLPVGDSTLVIAEVTDIQRRVPTSTPPPLLYHDGGYVRASQISD